jgi:dCTP deaminase
MSPNDEWEIKSKDSGFLTAETIRQHAARLFPDSSTAEAKGASVDLTLGAEHFITSQSVPACLTYESPYVVIPRGEFGLLTTAETVHMPTDLLAFITMKLKYKSKGVINVSGFHVDPGFRGTLAYSVFNAGPGDVTLKLGEKVFTMFFATLTAPAEPYDGQYNGLKGLQSDLVAGLAGAPNNLVKLEERIRSLEVQLRVAGAVALGVAVPLALLVIQALN